MKKIRLFILLIACMAFIPVVNAASANTVVTGTNTVNVGKTTEIYVKLNSSASIEGVDITYATSGNITVTNVSVADGFMSMGRNGNRYILYAMDPVPSGSTILVLTVKGNSVGKGTVSVSNLEATVSGETVVGGSKSYEITVKSSTTSNTTTNNNKKNEEDSLKKEEERKAAIAAATQLVEQAETSLTETDYTKALEAVNLLENSDEKTELLDRLNDVKFKIAVSNECKSQETPKCEECKETNDDAKPWIILSIVLIISLILETVYLVYAKTREN